VLLFPLEWGRAGDAVCVLSLFWRDVGEVACRSGREVVGWIGEKSERLWTRFLYAGADEQHR